MIRFISYFGLAFQRIYPRKPNLRTDPKPLTKAIKMPFWMSAALPGLLSA